MHDTLLQVIKVSALYYKNKNIFTRITAYLHLLTFSYGDVKLTSAATLRADKLDLPPS